MMVCEMEETMPNAEYVAWGVYFARKRQKEELAAKMARHR